MKTLDARPVCWLVVWWAAALGGALPPHSAASAGSLRVQPAESLSTLREKLASDEEWEACSGWAGECGHEAESERDARQWVICGLVGDRQ